MLIESSTFTEGAGKQKKQHKNHQERKFRGSSEEMKASHRSFCEERQGER